MKKSNRIFLSGIGIATLILALCAIGMRTYLTEQHHLQMTTFSIDSHKDSHHKLYPKLKPFTAVEISGVTKTSIRKGATYRLQISSPYPIAQDEVFVEDHVLHIFTKNGSAHHGMNVSLVMPEITRLTAKGMNQIALVHFQQNALSIVLKGMDDITGENL